MAKPVSSPPSTLVLTGLTGAGKTLIVQQLETMGWYGLDGIPPQLLPQLLTAMATERQGDTAEKPLVIALSLRHALDQDVLQEWLTLSPRPQVVFLSARSEILQRRLNASRRTHPALAPAGTLATAIHEEEQRLFPLMGQCDHYLDTSDLLPVHLLPALESLGVYHRAQPLQISLISFGYKYGIPADAHLVFDVRFLPNPYYEPTLRPLTGRDPQLQEYLWAYPQTQKSYHQIHDLIKTWLPSYREEGRPHLTVAIGCTGGQHRSVTLIERLGQDLLNSGGHKVTISHRHLTQSQREMTVLGGVRHA